MVISTCSGARFTPKNLDSLLVILCATSFYIYLFGWRTLDPTFTAWMLHGDAGQHYLGWQFFQNESWQWPPGRILSFGFPTGTALAFTDSIPLLALLLKPFSSVFPAHYHYFGVWILLCFTLNGYFGLRLLSRLTERRWLCLIGSCFFILSPPVLFRSGGHESLMAHWLILAGIEICLLGGWHWARWLSLSAIAALCHPYLLLMVLGLLVANSFGVWLVERRVPLYRLLRDITGISIVVFGLLWIVGYFTGKGGFAAVGYSYYSMNILAFFDPVLGYSRFLTQNTFHRDFIPSGQYEGNLYLGAGMILLAISAVTLLLSSPQPILNPLFKRYRPLIVVTVIYWIFALSNKVMLGSVHLLTFPLPDGLIRLLSIFRASGRFGWPLFYLVNFAIIATVIRYLPYRSALVILSGALMLQVVDLSKPHNEMRKSIIHRMAWETPLKDQKWNQLATSAKKLIVIPTNQPMEKIYLPFAYFAVEHGLATNAAHLARTDEVIAQTYVKEISDQLANGHYDPETIYVFFDFDQLKHISTSLRAKIIQLDGYNVLPPVLSE